MRENVFFLSINTSLPQASNHSYKYMPFPIILPHNLFPNLQLASYSSPYLKFSKHTIYTMSEGAQNSIEKKCTSSNPSSTPKPDSDSLSSQNDTPNNHTGTNITPKSKHPADYLHEEKIPPKIKNEVLKSTAPKTQTQHSVASKRGSAEPEDVLLFRDDVKTTAVAKHVTSKSDEPSEHLFSREEVQTAPKIKTVASKSSEPVDYLHSGEEVQTAPKIKTVASKSSEPVDYLFSGKEVQTAPKIEKPSKPTAAPKIEKHSETTASKIEKNTKKTASKTEKPSEETAATEIEKHSEQTASKTEKPSKQTAEKHAK